MGAEGLKEDPCDGAWDGLTARTGRSQSGPIDRPASEVGDNMTDTMPLKSENQINTRAFCPRRRIVQDPVGRAQWIGTSAEALYHIGIAGPRGNASYDK